MSGREILTVQFGHYANFVGTNWWNIQEQSFEYNTSSVTQVNHDVLYREGHINKGQVTFTPRLLLVDLHGSLKTLPEQGYLYDKSDKQPRVEWDETLVDVQKENPANKSKFLTDLENDVNPSEIQTKEYDLDQNVQVWSDFLYTRFHPRSVNIIKEYQHCNEHTPFDTFPLGSNLWQSSQFQDDFSDKIRNYIEECDNLQGFHILTDSTNAFVGLSSSCAESLRDEYGRKSILVFPVVPSFFADNDCDSDTERAQSLINDSVRTLNLAFGFHEFSSSCDLVVPLSLGQNGWRQPGSKREFPHINYDEKRPYHSSAILAAALDTLTMKYRLRSSHFCLADLCADLNQHGRSFAAASLSLPFPIHENSDLLDCLDKIESALYQSITPRCSIGTVRNVQYMTLRGISEERLKKPLDKAKNQRELPAYKCETVAEMMQMYLSYTTHATISNVTVVHKPLDVKNPFPKIFDEHVGINGDICDEARPIGRHVESIPLLAGVHSGAEIGQMLESLHTEARRIKIGRFHQFTGGNLQKEDFEECLDNLFSVRENYEDSYLI